MIKFNNFQWIKICIMSILIIFIVWTNYFPTSVNLYYEITILEQFENCITLHIIFIYHYTTIQILEGFNMKNHIQHFKKLKSLRSNSRLWIMLGYVN